MLTNSSGTSGTSLTSLSPSENLNNNAIHQAGRDGKSGAISFLRGGIDLACVDETISNNHIFFFSELGLGHGGVLQQLLLISCH